MIADDLINQTKKQATRFIDKPLTSTEFQELLAVSSNPFEFAKRIFVIHPIRGKVPFILYPFQKAVLWNFIRNRFNIILKFRQAGVTELISLFCLWFAMYHSNKNIVIISIKEHVAKKVLRKIKFMYRNLPEHLKVQIVNGRSKDLGTASEIEFANGSIITSVPTTEEAGRSEALSLLVIDEAAIIRWADQIWAAAFPTLSTGGRAILNSTPYGVNNFFHRVWVSACAGGNGFTPIRLKWNMHPERNQNWYDQMRADLGPRRTAQEIDGDFLTSGNSVFDLLDIRAIEERLDSFIPLNIAKEPDYQGLFKIRNFGNSLKIFEKPDIKRRYTIGADVATGRARDFSAFSIMDDHGNEVGCFKGKIPVTEYSQLLAKLGRIYWDATLAPESNDIGLSVSSKLEEEGYPNLHYSVKLLKERGKSKPKEEKIAGWYTTKKNRPIIINELEEDIRLDNIDIKDEFFVQEAYTFVYDEQNKPIAMGRKDESSQKDEALSDDDYHDDAIMAKAITNHTRKIRRKGVIILPV